jgi:hypothetical protein
MKKISSKLTIVSKWVTPLYLVGFTCYWEWGVLGDFERLWFFGVLGLLFFLLFILIYFRMLWPLADAVYDGGDYLLVQRRGEEVRVRLEEIADLSLSHWGNMRRMILRFAHSGPFGECIQFMPPVSLAVPYAVRPLEEDLMRRVNAARRKVAA